MEYIAHRINTLAMLRELPQEYGVEIDLRDDLEGRIYLSHDPFVSGEYFEDYLKEYKHGTMILNIKSERIELQAMQLLKRYGIQKYFFLDSSFPMMYLLSNQGVRNIAVRVSEYESLETARNMKGKANWIWADCFQNMPLTKSEIEELKIMGYRICLVSPELQGRNDEIEKYKSVIEKNHMCFDAVCTKACNIEKWKTCD